MPDAQTLIDPTGSDPTISSVKIQRWGALASFLLALTFITAPLIYLTGDLCTAIGPWTYDLADFLYGPLWAASLVTAVYAIRERIGDRAPRRMNLALLAAFIAAGMIVGVACLRAANRHYHLSHPELHLETSTSVLVVWTTLIAGVTAAGWHFLGWVQVLVGSAGWTSRRLPRGLSGLYLAIGTLALFVYLRPDGDLQLVPLNAAACIWLGILLWKATSGETQRPETDASRPAS